MLFNSFVFAVFIVITYGAYLATMRHLKVQNFLMLVASYVFYGWWDWRFLSLLIGSTVLDYWLAHGIERLSDPRHKKMLLTFSVVTNLGILGFFKYFNFFAASTVDLLRTIGFEADSVTIDVILPLGISFYVFQSMSYVLDVYRGDLKACPRLLDFALFVSFFPQLVAGPIERATNLLPQILKPRTLRPDQIQAGVFLVVVGLFKKVVIADNLAPIANQVFDNYQTQPGLSLIAGALAFTFQIYCDFSGYSDIARGLAKTMGFEFMVNFRLPYFALSPSDFWRRWHISLSTWLRDYLYIPLGGNRGSELATARNLFLTMLIGGLWHGAAWHFVAWGAFHGLLLVAYRYLAPKAGNENIGGVPIISAKTLAQCALMFSFTVIGWILFRAQTLEQAWYMISHLGFDRVTESSKLLKMILRYVGPLLILQIFEHYSRDLLFGLKWPMPVRVATVSGLVIAMMLFGFGGASDFIYFQF